MTKQNKLVGLKIIASVLVFTFSYSQILYAADVRQMLVDAKNFFIEEDARRPHGSSIEDLEAAQAQQQSVVDQQQALEDFQNTNFSLTTANGDVLKYVGDKLKAVERPDGTKLANIITDAAGVIQNADLSLIDGSVQIYQAGKVVGYMTPDGQQVIYTNGEISKVISKAGVETFYTYVKDGTGKVTQTTLDNSTHNAIYDANGKIKQVTRKSDNQKIFYTNGMIQKIVNADASQILFTATVLAGDTTMTPQGSSGGGDVVIDAQGNKFYFTSGAVSKVVLTDNSSLESITWDASNKIDSATLTEADGSKYIYQLKLLTRSYDVAGIVTNYTTTAAGITAVKAGETYEYLLDKTAVSFTDLVGNKKFFIQSGTYKGLLEKETLSSGVTYLYDYAGVATAPAVTRREAVSSLYNINTLDGQTVNLQSTNPKLNFDLTIPNDGSIDQAVVAQATASGKTLKLNLVAGTGSTYVWNGVTTSLGLTLNKGSSYKVELRWETGRVGIYVYGSALTRPATPTASIADRAWDPKFKVVATNSKISYDWTLSSGYFNQNFDMREKNYGYVGGAPVAIFNFKQKSTSYKTIMIKATQSVSGNITRSLQFYYDTAGIWYNKISDYNSSTGVTTNTTTQVSQTFTNGVEYTAEVRHEGAKMNLYVYQKGTAKPTTPLASLDAFNVSSKLEMNLVSFEGSGNILKNSTAQTYSTTAHASKTLTARTDTVKNLTLVKPAAPSTSGVNTTDFNSIVYDSLANLKQVNFKDGSKLIFDKGVLKQSLDAAGKSTTFNFEQSGLANITGSSIVQSNLTTKYAADGKISELIVGDLKVHYWTDGTTVDWIEKADGTELYELKFSAAGALTDATIVTPDGEERKYVAGKLASVRRADQSQLFYAADKVTKMITPNKITYNFVHSTSKIEALLDATVTPVPDALTPIKMEYDTSFNLTKVTRQNQEIISYASNQVSQIAIPDKAAQVFNYTKDAAGKVLSYTVTQGNVVTTYDANNQPISAKISPTTDNPHTFDVAYQYGKMRTVKKNGVQVFTYTYNFDVLGAELTQVDDTETNTTKIYKDSNLQSSLDKNTSVLTSYKYGSDSKVSEVKVTRFDRLLHTYAYSYSGTDTIVGDELGVKRTYDSAQKLKFLEKDGQKFGYSYTPAVAGATTTTTQQTVLPVTTLGTSNKSTSTLSYMTWNANTTENSLSVGSSGTWVEYAVTVAQNGDLKIEFDSTQFGGSIPASYQFNLEFSVDGVLKKTHAAPLGSSWNSNALTLTGLTAGNHVVRLKWINDYYVAGQYDANFKFRNMKMTHSYQTTSTAQAQPEIVEEALLEKKLSDGSVAKYVAGKVSEITYSDGRILKNIKEDALGLLGEGTMYQNISATTGTKINFLNGQISKVTLTSGQVLDYAYDRDASGVVTTTWIKKGTVNLKYDAQDSLAGLKILGILTPDEVKAAVTNTYIGGSGGSFSYDGNFATAQADGFGGGADNKNLRIYSEHYLPTASTVTNITYQMTASASSSGVTNNGAQAYTYIETKDATTGIWSQVPGTYMGQNNGDPGKGSSTAYANTATPATVTVNISNVSAIRAMANAAAYANESGTIFGTMSINEIQFDLADQSAMTFSTIKNTSGQATGYTLTGTKGVIGYGLTGAVTQANASYAAVQAEMTSVIQNYTKTPYKNADFNVLHQTYSDGQSVISQEFSKDGILETQTKGDGTVTLFENGKPSKVLDRGGNLLIQYAFDAAGNPTRVYLKNARDTLPGEVLKAKQNIEAQRALELRNLAKSKNLAYLAIQNQVQNIQMNLANQIATMQASYDNTSKIEVKGKQARSQKSDALEQINGNINAARTTLIDSYSQEADAYAALDAQVLTLSNKIESDTVLAITEVNNQEVLLKKEILRQEISPIVYDYYRRILGRDPSSAEYDSWVQKLDYNSGNTMVEVKTTTGVNLTAALKTFIEAMPELAERKTYVSTIKGSVTTALNSYMSMTQVQKEAYAATLGLAAVDLIPISTMDKDKILVWLNSRSLHFGQSAFLALESLLEQKGKVFTRTELGKQAIMVDILAGVISPLDDGDMVLSIFSLTKIGQLYGVDLVGGKANWNSLKAIIPQTASAATPRVIAHINGNHFVIITAMTDTSITYIDTGIGKDKQNESVTVTKDGFMKVWQGNLILNRNDLGSMFMPSGSIWTWAMGMIEMSRQLSELMMSDVTAVDMLQAITPRYLSVQETKSIRGAYYGSILSLIGSILSIVFPPLAVPFQIAALVASIAEGDWITGIASAVTLGFSGFGAALGNVFKGAVQGFTNALGPLGQVIQQVGTFFGSVYSSVTGFFSTISQSLGGFLQGAFNASSKAAADVAQKAVSWGIKVGVTKGLEALGVNPVIASLAGSFAEGSTLSAMQYGTFDIGSNFGAGMKTLLTTANQTVLQNSGLNSTLIDVLNTVALPIVSGVQNGSINGTPTIIFNELKQNISTYGLEKIGSLIGLDSAISSAIAAPLSANIFKQLATTTWTGQVPTGTMQSATISGEYYYDEARGVNVYFPVTGTVERTFFDNALSFLRNNLPLMAAAGISAYYASQAKAVGTGLSSVPATTTEVPIPQGATAVNYTDYATGTVKAGYQIGSGTNYTVYDKLNGLAVKRVSNNVVEEGVFESVMVREIDGSFDLSTKKPSYLSKGRLQYTTEQSGKATFVIVDKKVYEVKIDAPAPDIILSSGATKDATNKILNGIVEIAKIGLKLVVTNGSVSKSSGGSQGSSELRKKMTSAFIFGNGFENERRLEDTPDPLVASYVLDLEGRALSDPKIVDPLRKLMLYLYEMTDMIGNGVDWLGDFKSLETHLILSILEGPTAPIIDLLNNSNFISALPAPLKAYCLEIKNYLSQTYGIGNNLVQEVINELDSKGPIEDGIAFVHSGATAPLLSALKVKPYDIQTVIIFEGPHPNYYENINNPNLQQVIHVMGSKHGPVNSVLEGDSMVPFLNYANFTNSAYLDFENINIEIEGAFHNDYSYNPADYADHTFWDAKKAERQMINRRTNLFMRDLYQAVLRDQTEPGALQFFFSGLLFTNAAIRVSGIWNIDPRYLRDIA